MLFLLVLIMIETKSGRFHTDRGTHWIRNKNWEKQKKKRKRKEKGKMLKELNILPVLRLYGKHALCTNCLESSPWPIGDCGRNPCPFIERRLLLETPRGNCQQFLRNAFRGTVSASWICLGNGTATWAGRCRLLFCRYFWSKIKCLCISLKWILIERAALLEVHQTNVVWCFSFPNPRGTCP